MSAPGSLFSDARTALVTALCDTRQGLSLFWFCRVRGKCIACGRPAHRRGSLFGVCGRCGGADRDWTPKRRLA